VSDTSRGSETGAETPVASGATVGAVGITDTTDCASGLCMGKVIWCSAGFLIVGRALPYELEFSTPHDSGNRWR